MSEQYRVTRSFGGGYTIRKSDVVEGSIYGAAGVVSSVLSASIGGIATLARQDQDRKLVQSIESMVDAAEYEHFDDLLNISGEFTRKYSQQPYGPYFSSLAYAGKRQYKDALAAAERSVQLGLPPLEAAKLRINIYRRQENVAELLKEWTLVTQHDETRHDGYMGRAEVLLQIADLDQALDDVNQAISLLPDKFGYCLRADIYRARHDLDKALDDYTRAIRLGPDDAVPLERRSELYALLDKTDEALADHDAAKRVGAVASSGARTDTVVAKRPVSICESPNMGSKFRDWPTGTRFKVTGVDHESWKRVQDPDGFNGWVPRKAVERA